VHVKTSTTSFTAAFRYELDGIAQFAILPTFFTTERSCMSRANRLALLVICATCVVPGCGTVQYLSDSATESEGARPYGGVRYGVEGSTSLLMDTTGGHGGLPGFLVGKFLGTYWLLVDLPLSVVGDTLTLPVVWAKSMEQRKATPAWTPTLDAR